MPTNDDACGDVAEESDDHDDEIDHRHLLTFFECPTNQLRFTICLRCKLRIYIKEVFHVSDYQNLSCKGWVRTETADNNEALQKQKGLILCKMKKVIISYVQLSQHHSNESRCFILLHFKRCNQSPTKINHFSRESRKGKLIYSVKYMCRWGYKSLLNRSFVT